MTNRPTCQGCTGTCCTGLGSEPCTCPQLEPPAGAQPITTDEAVHRIVTGDHCAAHLGNAEIDGAMIKMLRDGALIAAYNPTTHELYLQLVP